MDPLLLTTVFTSLLPVAVDGIKTLIGRKTGDKPAVLTADDYAKVTDVDVRKLQALAELDKPQGSSYPWVEAVRSLQRPVVVSLVMVSWLYGVIFPMPPDKFLLVSQLASSVFFFLFGERVSFYVQQRIGK